MRFVKQLCNLPPAVIPPATPASEMHRRISPRLVCRILDSTETATATKYVDVKLPDGWVVGQPIIVCERLDVVGLTGLVPFPRKGQIRDISVLTIEQPDTDPLLAQPDLDYAAVLPTGDWTWCQQ